MALVKFRLLPAHKGVQLAIESMWEAEYYDVTLCGCVGFLLLDIQRIHSRVCMAHSEHLLTRIEFVLRGWKFRPCSAYAQTPPLLVAVSTLKFVTSPKIVFRRRPLVRLDLSSSCLS